MKAVVIEPDGSSRNLRFKQPDTLAALQKAVGGYIEKVELLPRNPDLVLLVNEEGRLAKLPYNDRASMLAGEPIVGPAIVIKRQVLG